jgi:hypothetical protein
MIEIRRVLGEFYGWIDQSGFAEVVKKCANRVAYERIGENVVSGNGKSYLVQSFRRVIGGVDSDVPHEISGSALSCFGEIGLVSVRADYRGSNSEEVGTDFISHSRYLTELRDDNLLLKDIFGALKIDSRTIKGLPISEELNWLLGR